MKYLTLVISLFLSACTTEPPVKNGLPYLYGGNDCLPQAAAMTEALKKVGIKADILTITSENYRHAVCRYVYPIGSDQLWMWDSHWGATKFPVTRKDDAQLCAETWIKWMGTGEHVTGDWIR